MASRIEELRSELAEHRAALQQVVGEIAIRSKGRKVPLEGYEFERWEKRRPGFYEETLPLKDWVLRNKERARREKTDTGLNFKNLMGLVNAVEESDRQVLAAVNLAVGEINSVLSLIMAIEVVSGAEKKAVQPKQIPVTVTDTDMVVEEEPVIVEDAAPQEIEVVSEEYTEELEDDDE